jgi:hypothetical protein
MMETRRMPAAAAAGVRLNDTIICLRSRFDEDSFQVCASGVRSFESIRPNRGCDYASAFQIIFPATSVSRSLRLL